MAAAFTSDKSLHVGTVMKQINGLNDIRENNNYEFVWHKTTEKTSEETLEKHKSTEPHTGDRIDI